MSSLNVGIWKILYMIIDVSITSADKVVAIACFRLVEVAGLDVLCVWICVALWKRLF